MTIMAKELQTQIKLQVPGGQANPAPPIGPALGQAKVNIGEFVTRFNEGTKNMKGKFISFKIRPRARKKYAAWNWASKPKPKATNLCPNSCNIIAGAVTSKSWVDSFPVLAQIFGTIAVWQTNPRAIRFIMLAPRPLWFIYNLIVGSYAGMATEIFIFLSVVTGIVRFDILGKPKKQAKE